MGDLDDEIFCDNDNEELIPADIEMMGDDLQIPEDDLEADTTIQFM
jgi:hypothetical protein